MRLAYPAFVWRRVEIQVPVTPIHRARIGAEHFAFGGAMTDLAGYFLHWPYAEGLGKVAALVACLALYMEHAEERRFAERRRPKR